MLLHTTYVQQVVDQHPQPLSLAQGQSEGSLKVGVIGGGGHPPAEQLERHQERGQRRPELATRERQELILEQP